MKIPEVKKDPVSLRLSEEVNAKFKEIAETLGGSQNDALDSLIRCYEAQAGKAAFPDRINDIEKLDGYLAAISNAFMGLLEENANMKDIVGAELQQQLAYKDKLIAGLQGKLDSQREEYTAAVRQNREYKDRVEQLETDLQKTEELLDECRRENREWKENFASLSNRCAEFEKKTKEQESDIHILKDNVGKMAGERDKYTQMAADMQVSLKRSEIQIGELNEKIHYLEEMKDLCEESAEKKYEGLLDTAVERARMQAEMAVMKNADSELVQMREERDKYKEKYIELLERINGQVMQ